MNLMMLTKSVFRLVRSYMTTPPCDFSTTTLGLLESTRELFHPLKKSWCFSSFHVEVQLQHWIPECSALYDMSTSLVGKM